MTTLAQPLVREGFAASAARRWVRESYRDWLAPTSSPGFIRRAHRSGFTVAAYREVQALAPRELPPISQRDYHSLHPLNDTRPWLRNRVVGGRRIAGLASALEEPIAIVSRASAAVAVRPISDEFGGIDTGVVWLLELVRERESVRVVSLAWGYGTGHVLSWTGGQYLWDGDVVTEDVIEATLLARAEHGRLLVTQHTRDETLTNAFGSEVAYLRVYLGKSSTDDVLVLDAEVLLGRARSHAGSTDMSDSMDEVNTAELPARRRGRWDQRIPMDVETGAVDTVRDGAIKIPHFDEIVENLGRAFGHARAGFTFLSVVVHPDSNGGVTVLDIDPEPPYPHHRLFNTATNGYLRAVLDDRAPARHQRALRNSARGRAQRQAARLVRRLRTFDLRAAGYTGRAARSWVWTMNHDRATETWASAKQIAQAHEWGFPVAVARDFGITEGNRSRFLSRREFLYAHPLNGKYEKWLRDRVSALLVFAPFDEHFDSVHYQIFRRGGAPHIVAISPDAKASGASLDDLGALLDKTGPLVLAPTAWQSAARATVAREGSSFVVDGIKCSRHEFHELLSAVTRDQSHVIVEPTSDHSANEDDASTFIVDVTMMNEDGANPQIAEAFVQFRDDHASETGEEPLRFVCRVNPATGSFEQARALIEGRTETFTHHPLTDERFSGSIPSWPRVVDLLQRMLAFAPQLRFVQFRLVVDAESIRVQRVSASPHYSRLFPFEPHTVSFLRGLIDEKRSGAFRLRARVARGMHNAKLKIRREYAKAFFPKGLLPYQAVRWPGDIRRDLVQRNGVPLRTKLWAYRHGFLSYRIPQYGITPQNRHQFISDFEYRWLRHINERYKYWLEDKVSIKYVAADFNEFLPAYYFYTHRSGGRNHVVQMMDCPEGYGAEYSDVLRLARELGVLALKPDEGSHGEGFYRLGWEDGVYSLNGVVASEQDVIDVLANPQNRYLITEFIHMHPAIAEIYPTSVNTIRMIVFKKDGLTPELGNAYLRIGSVASGYVDNTAAGGMLAEIDVDSGRFGNAQTLVNGRVTPCPRHPDTDVLIEGTVPNWDLVKDQILEMAASFSQLEYLGFDVAITPDGFKIPEINRFPDYPRIDRLTPATIDYLLLKLEQKKRRYGYHRQRPRTLVKLPERALAEGERI
ncbi:sugar-transfer associated ATP-grasp domain-containing protein [Microbacterium alcoholitolerans]|uniref:sugar-transfer associated ATP-grasp domain-containing protein n=1 Tax=unclassified Microbacterium TaxID=2609290 RepID=UPI003D181F93